MTPENILYIYTGRRPIEVVFRESKQYLGLQDGQARTQKAVERITPFCLWLNALVKVWFISDYHNARKLTPAVDDWYEEMVRRFYAKHLALCHCAITTSNRPGVRAGLVHFMQVLRSDGHLADKPRDRKQRQIFLMMNTKIT